MSPRVVALAGTLVQWEVLTGLHTIELAVDVYGMYEATTCSRRDSPRREPLTPASASLPLVVILGHRTSLLCALGGHVSWNNTRPQRLWESPGISP